jgi:branched-chain amino acid transport system permease protein
VPRLACIFGVLLGAPTLKLRGDYLAIVTLGFGEIIRIFMNNLNAPINITNGAQGITLIDPIRIGDFSFSQTSTILGVTLSGPQKYYFLLVALALLVIVVNIRLQDSRIGRAWQAIREDEVAAKACGINTRNIKLLAFRHGCLVRRYRRWRFFGNAGIRQSREFFTLMESITILAMVVLGGMGHIPGVILGAVLLTGLAEGFALRHRAATARALRAHDH